MSFIKDNGGAKNSMRNLMYEMWLRNGNFVVAIEWFSSYSQWGEFSIWIILGAKWQIRIANGLIIRSRRSHTTDAAISSKESAYLNFFLFSKQRKKKINNNENYKMYCI